MGNSRIESILRAIVDGTESSELPDPESRNEALLIQTLDKINVLDEERLPVNQGAANIGKLLGVGADGNVAPVSAYGTGIIVTETVVSGEDYELSIVEGEDE